MVEKLAAISLHEWGIKASVESVIKRNIVIFQHIKHAYEYSIKIKNGETSVIEHGLRLSSFTAGRGRHRIHIQKRAAFTFVPLWFQKIELG